MIKKLFQQLPLGKIEKEPELLTGGCSHQSYRIQTDQGIYAVKQLDAKVLEFLGGIDCFQRRDDAVKLLEMQGFPAVSAIHIDEQFAVYPWVEGRLLALSEIKDHHIKKIAELLVKVHQYEVVSLDFPFAPWQYLPETDWAVLFQDKKTIDRLKQYEQLYRQAWLSLKGQEVLSHGDLNYTNVLWINDKPYVVDWESLGLTYPKAELMSNALAWTGFVTHQFNRSLFDLMLKHYEEIAQENLTLTDADFYASWGYWLIWLVFSQKRILGLLPCSLEQKVFYEKSVLKTLDLMERLASDGSCFFP